jgi:hypothetical protein
MKLSGNHDRPKPFSGRAALAICGRRKALANSPMPG